MGNPYPHLQRFISHAGRIDWSPADFEGAVIPPRLLPAMAAASQLEWETRVELLKVRQAGLLKDYDLATFFPLWISEEAEHSRALRFIANGQGARLGEAKGHRGFAEALRNRMASVGAFSSRILPSNDVLFLGIGAGAEHMTRTMYRQMARQVEHDGVKRFLFRVAAQEGRHLTFFKEAAVARKPPSRTEKSLLRSSLSFGWRPVGIDRLGVQAWFEVFWPLMEDDDTQRELRRMDDILNDIPLFSGLGLMDQFLGANKYRLNNAKGYCSQVSIED